MKKAIRIIISLTLLLVLFTTGTFAAGSCRGRSRTEPTGTGTCYAIVSQFPTERGNGICNRLKDRICPQGFVDEDGDNICDHRGECRSYGRGQNRSFTDSNNDGICDLCGCFRKNNFRTS